MTPPILPGSRVRLRPVAVHDVDPWFAIASDPVTMRYWSCPPYADREQARAKIEELRATGENGESLPWAIADDADTLIGMVTLHRIDSENGRAEIGYLLARPLWGRGLATEAASLAIDHAFGPLGLRRLEADIDPRNTGSARLLERLGFVREGLLRERWQVAGEISDTAFYGLLAREWSARR